jgi:hypothetical protein
VLQARLIRLRPKHKFQAPPVHQTVSIYFTFSEETHATPLLRKQRKLPCSNLQHTRPFGPAYVVMEENIFQLNDVIDICISGTMVGNDTDRAVCTMQTVELRSKVSILFK